MSFEPFLAFFLVWRIRKNLRTSSAPQEWNKLLTYAMYAIGLLFVVDVIFSHERIIIWIWYLLLFLIITIAFREPLLQPVRMLMLAVLPLVAISFLKHV